MKSLALARCVAGNTERGHQKSCRHLIEGVFERITACMNGRKELVETAEKLLKREGERER